MLSIKHPSIFPTKTVIGGQQLNGQNVLEFAALNWDAYYK